MKLIRDQFNAVEDLTSSPREKKANVEAYSLMDGN